MNNYQIEQAILELTSLQYLYANDPEEIAHLQKQINELVKELKNV